MRTPAMHGRRGDPIDHPKRDRLELSTRPPITKAFSNGPHGRLGCLGQPQLKTPPFPPNEMNKLG